MSKVLYENEKPVDATELDISDEFPERNDN